jgi:adenine-specific DNA-methyltransferase
VVPSPSEPGVNPPQPQLPFPPEDLVEDAVAEIAFLLGYTPFMGRHARRLDGRGHDSGRIRGALSVFEEIAGVTSNPNEILQAGKAAARIIAHSLGTRALVPFARAFTYRMTMTYWNEVQRGCSRKWPLPPQFVAVRELELAHPIATVAARMGVAGAQLDPVSAGYVLGTSYAAMLPKEMRARLGVYYTPPALAARLLDQATEAGVDWATASVLDPACGGGAFLAPTAQRIVKHLSHLEPTALIDQIVARLRGFEIDAFAAWLSQVFLESALMPVCQAAGRRLSVVVDVHDSLTHEPLDKRYDLVIGNPPYGRVTLAPRLRRRYARCLYGHANLYGVFTDLALRWAKDGGVVAYVTPTSFLAGEYFTRLRMLLSRDAPPAAIDFIAQRKGVFDDVLQEALLATYRRGATPVAASVYFITPMDDSSIEVRASGSFRLPDRAGDPWILPRTADQERLVECLRRTPHRLADWGYTVSTGPLVWNRHKDQLRSSLTPGAYPLIWAEAVASDGRFVFRAAKKNHEPYFRPTKGQEWLMVREPCVLVQRTTAKEQTRRLIAAALPPGFLRRYGAAVIENHLNMIRPIRPNPVPPAVLTAFLNSAVADRAFRCITGSVAVSAYELEALPLPSPENLSTLARLVASDSGPVEIDDACTCLYGISPDG